MKTEKEIKDELEKTLKLSYYASKNKKPYDSFEFHGMIKALKWVLEE